MNRLGIAITLLWRDDVLDARFVDRPVRVTVGEACDLVVPDEALGGRAVVLIEPDEEGGFALSLRNRRMTGELRLGGRRCAIRDVRDGTLRVPGRTRVGLAEGDSARATWGDFTVVLQASRATTTAALRDRPEFDGPLAASACLAFLITCTPIVLGWQTAPVEAAPTPMTAVPEPQRVREVPLEVRRPEPPPLRPAAVRVQPPAAVADKRAPAPPVPVAPHEEPAPTAGKSPRPSDTPEQADKRVAKLVNKLVQVVDDKVPDTGLFGGADDAEAPGPADLPAPFGNGGLIEDLARGDGPGDGGGEDRADRPQGPVHDGLGKQRVQARPEFGRRRARPVVLRRSAGAL